MKNAVSQYLNFLAEGCSSAPKHREYYLWEAENTRRLKIVSYTTSRKLRAIIDQAFGENKLGSIKPNQCFRNALLACFAHPKIEYVEGYLLIAGALPIEHAWNRWNGIDFDLTQEVLEQKQLPHYEVLTMDGNSVRFWANELETTGPYRVDHYFTNIRKEPVPKISLD